ncbi:hypothetical protein [Bacillus badius]|uniref:hypothetical protein n=1 Tax=Bacillus badius TaxID=1455 RepID=UPI0007B372F8|nr:hypothetical protein [Bacillus badius]KZR56950.1 hypothetical protein A3781_20430 [Bacillus badius]
MIKSFKIGEVEGIAFNFLETKNVEDMKKEIEKQHIFSSKSTPFLFLFGEYGEYEEEQNQLNEWLDLNPEIEKRFDMVGKQLKQGKQLLLL